MWQHEDLSYMDLMVCSLGRVHVLACHLLSHLLQLMLYGMEWLLHFLHMLSQYVFPHAALVCWILYEVMCSLSLWISSTCFN